ncbi:hypothetical protein GCM10009665_62810 [Kitasatospora nipponensis]|uniref:N-acetyltransferase domain-containing protein n=1 Tax=Kitasatospora nipponensis TaxID=258049 RepID=A0ABP4HGF8_9ACTN
MYLRDVELGAEDLDAYLRMRCDPVMMAELGGPLPREGIAEKVERDVRTAASDAGWIKMIVLDRSEPAAAGAAESGAGTGAATVVAGSVVLWAHEEDGEPISEIGWMVLPEFQGRGVGRRAVAALLELARADGRWGRVHAFPGTSNAPSNGICRSLGFTLRESRSVLFADRLLETNHWTLDLADAGGALTE